MPLPLLLILLLFCICCGGGLWLLVRNFHRKTTAADALLLSELVTHDARPLPLDQQGLASYLHEDVGQKIAAAKMNLGALRQQLRTGSVPTANDLDTVMWLLDEGCRDIRAVSKSIARRESPLDAELMSYLQSIVAELQQKGIQVNVTSRLSNAALARENFHALRAALREALINVYKHAHASSVEVQVSSESQIITATVEDNGSGIAAPEVSAWTASHRERNLVDAARGAVEVDSRPGRGTVVAIWMPAAPRSPQL